MKGRIHSRLVVILLVLLLSAGLFVVMGINRGLDLQGGVHLVLQVVTDDAVRIQTARAAQADPNFIRLDPEADARIRSEAVVQTITVIRNRLDKLGVAEGNVIPYGDAKDYQILVEWPGVLNPDRVKSVIQATAVLEFKLVDAGPFPTADAVRQNYNGMLPAQLEVMPDGQQAYYALQRNAVISGSDLKDAYVSRDENGHPGVGFLLTADGSERFGRLTEGNVGRVLAVVLDGRVQSAAQIEGRITESGMIRGGSSGFSAKQVEDLVLVLKSGALPAAVRYMEESVVGPSLGADSIHQGAMACAVALALVVAFMLLYYRWTGLNAVIAMVLNLVILLGSMAYLHATLTLPGIAGIVLTIGVGIDSNVLVFERIREELRDGNSPATAVATSFRRVFRTLVDTHLAALISAAFLFAFGTGAIKGFAVTLVIGLISNMFTSVFVSRTLFDWVLVRHGRGTTLSI